ncbi:MAG: ribosome silencing factor [Alphaproteobacteria bacterium]|nr:ribosome silencing factor [Alphaproteobacteria bacterium]
MSNSFSPLALKNLIEQFLDSKKAQDIVCIDLQGKSSIADYLIIASGTSQRQIGSTAQLLKEELKKKGFKTVNIEGLSQCDWVLIDAGDVIVHLFRPEIRAFYNLEKMWSVEISDETAKISIS